MGENASAVERSAPPTDDDESAAIRQDIEQTRAEMSGTIDAIQQRLSPETLTEQAKDTAGDITAQAKDAAIEVLDHAMQEAKVQARDVLQEAAVQARDVLQEARVQAREAVQEATAEVKAAVRGATIGKVETMVRSANETTNAARLSMMDTIKQNPLPAALAAVSLGWLFMNSRSAAARGSSSQHIYEAEYRGQRAASPGGSALTGQRYQGYGNSGYQGYPSTGSAQGGMGGAGAAIASAQEAAGDLAGQVGDTAGAMASQVGDTASSLAGQVGDTASNLADQTKETAAYVVEGAQVQAQRLEDRFQQTLRENPLAIGAVTLALGTAIGLVLPQTQRENALLGQARDTLVERAQNVAQETIEKVGHVAEEAQDTIKQEAKHQGLTAQ